MKMTTPSPVKGIHGKLHKSPFFSQKMGREEKFKMAEQRQKTIKASAGAAGGSEVEEEVRTRKGMRYLREQRRCRFLRYSLLTRRLASLARWKTSTSREE